MTVSHRTYWFSGGSGSMVAVHVHWVILAEDYRVKHLFTWRKRILPAATNTRYQWWVVNVDGHR